jgi:predicted nucleic-acid-binding protein
MAKIALDTNVLLRYVIEEKSDARQTTLARQYVRDHCTLENPGYINCIVLCELVWALRRPYRYENSAIVAVLESILGASELQVEHEGLLLLALEAYRRYDMDIADVLIGNINRQAGCSVTVTFDKKAAALAEFELLS